MRRSDLMSGSMLAVPRVSPLPGLPVDPWAPKGKADIVEDIDRAIMEAIGRVAVTSDTIYPGFD